MEELITYLNEHVQELLKGRRLRREEKVYRINRDTMEILEYDIEDEILGFGKFSGRPVARITESGEVAARE